MGQLTRKEMHDLLVDVRDGRVAVEVAEEYARVIVMNHIGEDEALDAGAVHGFPEKWGSADKIAAKKTWIHARNHLKRGLRAKY